MRSVPIAISSVLALLAGGCSGGDGLPLGGPFGGNVEPSAITDAGYPADSDGVLPLLSSAGAGILGDAASPPTWTQLFKAYFASGTEGNCAHSGCHGNAMTSPSAAFSWLQSQGQVGGSSPLIANPNSSCLIWLGGDMPPEGLGSDPTLEVNLDLWANAGAKND